jgi:hypothetical protein
MTQGLLGGVISPGGTPPDRGTVGYLEGYSTMPWLRAIAAKISFAVANTEWTVSVAVRNPKSARAGDSPYYQWKAAQWAGREHRTALLSQKRKQAELREIEDHPLLDALQRGNAFQTGFQLQKLTQIYLDLVGDSFWLKERNGVGAPVGFWPLPPHWIRKTPSAKLPFYEIGYQSYEEIIPDTEILWLSDPNPVYPYGRGTGHTEAVGDELEVDEFAAKMCHDQETECLTRRGWKLGIDVTMDDEIATYNEILDRIEYHRPLDITNAPHKGVMHHWAGRSVDVMVTPNHRMWIKSKTNPVWHVKSDPVWHFEESHQVLAKPGRPIKWKDAGYYSGEQKVVEIPPAEHSTKRKQGSRGGGRLPLRGINEGLTYDVHAFATFLGWFISEGHIESAGVYVSQTKKEYFDPIRKALQIFPQEWIQEKESLSVAGTVIHKWGIHHHSLVEWLRRETGDKDKGTGGSHYIHLPEEVFEWPYEAQRLLINALIDGDGTWIQSKSTLSASYGSASEELVDQIQRLCVNLGWSSLKRHQVCDGKTLFRLLMKCDRAERQIYKDSGTWATESWYEGQVWCVTVPNEKFFSRRNGSVFLGGNTKTVFINRARPDLLVMPTEGVMKEEEVTHLEQNWLNRSQGFWRAFRPFFLRRAVEVTKFDHNFRNIQLTTLRQHQRDVIMQTFGLPPEIMGVIENSNRSTIEGAEHLFSKYVIVPRLESIRSQLQQKLVPEYDERLILDYVSPVQEDKEHQLKAAQIAPWALTVDEWRGLIGKSEKENGSGNVHIMMANLFPTENFEPISVTPAPMVAPPVTENAEVTEPTPRSLEDLSMEDLLTLKRAGQIAEGLKHR